MAVFEYQNQVIFNMPVVLTENLAVILTLAFGVQTKKRRFWDTKSKAFSI
jgi:hypothetical protein